MFDRLPALFPIRERDRALLFVAVWVVALGVLAMAITAMAPSPVPAGSPVHADLVIRGLSWTVSRSVFTANATAFGLLREANETLGFELRWVPYGWPYDDVFVTSINGTENDAGRNLYWQYCVNGAYARVGASHQQIRDGDVVRWVFAAPGGSELCG